VTRRDPIVAPGWRVTTRDGRGPRRHVRVTRRHRP
jgi:hypothetical protein